MRALSGKTHIVGHQVLVALSMRALSDKVSYVSEDNEDEVGHVRCNVRDEGWFFDLLTSYTCRSSKLAPIFKLLVLVAKLCMGSSVRVIDVLCGNVEWICIEMLYWGEFVCLFRWMDAQMLGCALCEFEAVVVGEDRRLPCAEAVPTTPALAASAADSHAAHAERGGIADHAHT